MGVHRTVRERVPVQIGDNRANDRAVLECDTPRAGGSSCRRREEISCSPSSHRRHRARLATGVLAGTAVNCTQSRAHHRQTSRQATAAAADGMRPAFRYKCPQLSGPRVERRGGTRRKHQMGGKGQETVPWVLPGSALPPGDGTEIARPSVPEEPPARCSRDLGGPARGLLDITPDTGALCPPATRGTFPSRALREKPVREEP